MNILTREELISVIVPIYNAEKYLDKCLSSICQSSYQNIEIICVDDGTPDKSMKIVEKFRQRDDRIVVVTNTVNRGLFRARVAGIKASHGQYVCFVDADDSIGIDWLRLLHDKIVEEQADMVLGNTVNVDENNNYTYYNNYRSLTESHTQLRGENVLNTFMQQEGSNFCWHTVWNKLYRRELVEKCLPYFEKIDFHLVMGEDILFSSIFYTIAQSLSFVNADAYFYFRHSEASTSGSLPPERVLKNIKDVGKVFACVKEFLLEYDASLFKRHEKSYDNFKKRYHRIWSGNAYELAKHNRCIMYALQEAFDEKKLMLPRDREFYFYELFSPWTNKVEGIKNFLSQDDIKVVSFDIFDTLIVRPFYAAIDLQMLVAKFAHTLLPDIAEHLLFDCRRKAEEIVREETRRKNPTWEDVNLDEIYQGFAQMLGLDKIVVERIKQEEIRLELKFCYARKSAKELFEYVKYLGKRIVITSDMYLEFATIQKILHKNGFVGYEKLFLSSDKRALKMTGSLFDYVIKETGVKPKNIVHIGDNWGVDKICAEQRGLQTVFYPRTLEAMENCLQDVYVGEDLSFYRFRSRDIVEKTYFRKDFATRCMTALVANKWFDSIAVTFNRDSNYNGDTYHTGYATMGPHFWALANWIRKSALANGHKKIVFLARDGFLLKKVFDYICQKTHTDLQSSYFYASRKSLMPFCIKKAEDLPFICEYFDLSQKKHSPQTIMKLLEPVLKPLDEQTKANYLRDGIVLDKALLDTKEFYAFIKAVQKYSFDQRKCDENRKQMENEFSKEFSGNVATFDVGYSGKLQKIICDLAGKRVDSYFVHSNGTATDIVAKNSFKTYCFYDFTPTITAIIREFFISAQEPSCVGYTTENGELTPVFEEKTYSYSSSYALEEFQKGTWDFCKDFSDTFAEYLEEFSCRNVDASLPFEHYLLYASPFDRWAFSNSTEEDQLFGGYRSKSIAEIWDWHINDVKWHHPVDYPPRPAEPAVLYDIAAFSQKKRALFYFLFDRKKFKEKMKMYFSKKK